jgi:hypothetical protein
MTLQPLTQKTTLKPGSQVQHRYADGEFGYVVSVISEDEFLCWFRRYGQVRCWYAHLIAS